MLSKKTSVRNAQSPMRRRWWCFLVLLAGLLPRALGAQELTACDPAPAVKAALDQVPSQQTPQQTDWQFHDHRLAAIQKLLSQYPDDVFVERAYINAMGEPVDRDKVIDEYKARHQQSPDDPRLSYLYGLTLMGRESREAIKLFEATLEKAPKFPLPNLALVNIYVSPNFLDKAKATEHAKVFLTACPAAFAGYDRLIQVDDRELMVQGAARLRELLPTRSDADAIGEYSTLWSLEFKTHPPSDYEALRKQVAADLARLRTLNLQDKEEWYQALQEGYKLVNDQKQSDWAEDEAQRRFPHPWELAAMTKWNKDHPYPAADAPAEQKAAYYRDRLKQTEQWLKERPNTTFIWWQRLDAMEHLDDVSPSEVEAAVHQAYKVAEANDGPRGLESYEYGNIAEILSKKHLLPERVVEMAQKGLAQLEVESKRPMYDLYATKDNVEDNQFYQASQRVQGLVFETGGYLELKQADKAQLELAQIDERLEDLKTLAGDKDPRKKECYSQESSYWWLMGRLAELQNHKLDAMGYYENALLARFQAEEKPETGQKDELADSAGALWHELGGTQDGWNILYLRRATALANKATLTWEDANLPLPSFELTDLHGKTWQIADLKGKVTLLNFWASW
jgi:hypothetical protein